jgi:hypothetical protein
VRRQLQGLDVAVVGHRALRDVAVFAAVESAGSRILLRVGMHVTTAKSAKGARTAPLDA